MASHQNSLGTHHRDLTAPGVLASLSQQSLALLGHMCMVHCRWVALVVPCDAGPHARHAACDIVPIGQPSELFGIENVSEIGI